MKFITSEDIIESITDSLQYISYYHPPDYIQNLALAYEKEKSKPAKDAMAQILINSRMCAEGKRPICQDTGIVTIFCRVGMNAEWGFNQPLDVLINEGVRQAYLHPENKLRASVLEEPAGARRNTKDNTPAVIHFDVIPGNEIDFVIAAKGGGSENKSKFVMLNPSDSIVDWVVDTVPQMGAGWCPPGMLGLGIGGTAEKAMVMAKEALMEPIDIQNLIQAGPSNHLEEMRLEIYEKVNALGIGAQGLGGLTTVLDVKIRDYPTHAASKPVAMIPNCAATRHVHFSLCGEGKAELPVPSIEDWPKIEWNPGSMGRRVNLDEVSREEVQKWEPGETLLITGTMLTGRDAAHKEIKEIIEQGKKLPSGVCFKDRFIYYVGPVDPVEGEVVGPAGPTTSTRMDKFTDIMLEKAGLLGMIGKAERGPVAVEAIKRNRAVYLMAVGGAAYLVSKAIKKAKVIAFPELGMEAIHEFEVKDMPVTVAVDSNGTSVHETGPKIWRDKIGNIPVKIV